MADEENLGFVVTTDNQSHQPLNQVVEDLDKIEKKAQEAGDALDESLSKAGKSAKETADEVTSAAKEIELNIIGATDSVSDMSKSMDSAASDTQSSSSTINNEFGKIEQTALKTGESVKQLKIAINSVFQDNNNKIAELSEDIPTFLEQIQSWMNNPNNTLTEYTEAAENIKNGLEAAFDVVKDRSAEISKQINEFNDKLTKAYENLANYKANGGKNDDVLVELEGRKNALLDGLDALKQQKEQIDQLGDAYKQLNNVYKESEDAHSQLAVQFKMLRNEIEQLVIEETNAGKSTKDITSSDRYKELKEKESEIKKLMDIVTGDDGDNIKDTTKELNKLTRSISQMSAVFRSTGSPIAAFRAGLTALRGASNLTTISFKTLGAAAKSLFRILIANPLGLVIAAVTLLVLEIGKAISSIQTLAQKQADLNHQEARHLELLYAIQNLQRGDTEDIIKQKERELALMEAQNASLEDRLKKEQEIQQLKEEQSQKMLSDAKDEIDNLEELEKEVLEYKKALVSVQDLQDKNNRSVTKIYDEDETGARRVGTLRNTFGNFAYKNVFRQKRVIARVNGEVVSRGKSEDVVSDLESAIKVREMRIERAKQAKENAAEVEQSSKLLDAKMKDTFIKIQNANEDAIRETQNMQNQAIANGYAREIATVKQATKDRIAEIQRRIDQESQLLTEQQKEQLEKQKELQSEIEKQELARIYRAEKEQIRSVGRQIEDAKITSAPRTSEEQRADLVKEYQRMIEDVDSQKADASGARIKLLSQLQEQYREKAEKELEILNEKLVSESIAAQKEVIELKLSAVKEGSDEEYKLQQETIEKEREYELQANKQLAEDKRKDEALINAKYDKQLVELAKAREETLAQVYRDGIALRLEAVREGSVLELKYRLKQIELERQAELEANRKKDPSLQQSESAINAKYYKQRLALLTQDYESYQQQLTDLTETYELRRAKLEDEINDPQNAKRQSELKKALDELKKTYEKTYNDIQKELIRNALGKVFEEQTYENIKSAVVEINNLAEMTDEEIADKLGIDGTDPKNKAQIEAFKSNLQKVRRELQDMGDEAYSLKEALKDAFSGKTHADMTRGVDYLVERMGRVSSLVGGLAGSMRDFAVATDNVDIEKMADTFQHVADMISTAGNYAAAGAKVGGGWGAIVGALLGVGSSALSWIAEDSSEAAREKQQQETNNYFDEILDGITSIISAIKSLGDSVTSLDFSKFRESLVSAINETRSGIDNGNHWNDYYYNVPNATGYGMLGMLGDMDPEHLAKVIEDSVLNYLGSPVEDLYEKVSQGIELTYEELVRLTTALINVSSNLDVEKIVRTRYANQHNYENVQIQERRKELLEEMNRLYKEGSLDAMEYFNLLMKADKLALDDLKRQRQLAVDAGRDTKELDSQIAQLEFQMSERVKNMFEGLSGIDLRGIVEKWLDIFKEFGNNVSKAFDKIDESVDDMIKNMLVQTVLVGPMMKKLSSIIKEWTDKIIEEQGVTDESEIDWTQVNIWDGLFDKIKGSKGSFKDAYDALLRELNSRGLSWGSSDRSGSSKGITSVSQDSFDEYLGRVTAIQGHTFNIAANTSIIRENTNAMLGSVRMIEQYTQHLIRIDNDIHALGRAFNTLQTEGVKIK